MPTPSKPVTTALGVAIRDQRAGRSQRGIADAVGVPAATLSRLERGTHRPSADTARKLATWLGWTVEQVLDAADQPVAG